MESSFLISFLILIGNLQCTSADISSTGTEFNTTSTNKATEETGDWKIPETTVKLPKVCHQSTVTPNDSYVTDKTCLDGEEEMNPNTIRHDYLGYITIPLFLTVGITGNTFTVIIMRTSVFRQMTTSLVLTALALSDTTYSLLQPFNKKFVRQLLGVDVRALSMEGCKAFFCMYRSAKLASSWFVVLICIERFIAVYFPLKIKLISTKRNAAISIALLLFFIFSIDGFWTVTSKLVNGACIPNYRTPETETLASGFVIAGTIIFSVIPTIILVTLTPLTIVKLYRQKQKRSKMTIERRKSSDTAKSTAMLLGVTTAYIILISPISVLHSVAYFSGEDIFESTNPPIVTFREYAQVMEQLNYSINFFLYVLCSRSFRGKLFGLLGISWQKAKKPKENLKKNALDVFKDDSGTENTSKDDGGTVNTSVDLSN